jgi:hypothetical protein
MEVDPGKTLEEVALALDELAAAHEALRIRLVEPRDGPPFQVVEPPDRVRIECTEVTVPGDELALRQACARFAESPLDPTTSVARALLVTGTSARWLCLLVNHVACDAWGLSVLVPDLRELLSGGRMSQARRTQLSELVLARNPAREERNLGYWRERLAGLPAAASYSSGEFDQRSPGEALAFTLPGETMARVRRFAAAHSASPHTVVLCALTALAGGYQDQFRMVISINILNRLSRRELFTAACVFQRHYLPIDGDGTETTGERVRAVHEVCREGQQRAAFSSNALHDWLTGEAERRGAWFRPALVANHFFGGVGPGGTLVGPTPYAPATDTVQPLDSYWIDMAAHTRWVERGCSVELRISRPLLVARDIHLMRQDFLAVLDAMLDDPGAAVASLPVPRLESIGGTVRDTASGVSVDPGLVERLIAGLPAVERCRVAAVEDGGGTFLRATVRLDQRRPAPSERELRRALHQLLEHTRAAVVPREFRFE